MQLRIGLVGAGRMPQLAHIPSLKQIDGVEIVAIAEIDAEVAHRVANAYNIPRTYQNAEELLESEKKLDGVIIVTPQDHHADACLPALDRRIPVFMEKPLESTLEKGREIIAARRKHNTLMVIGYNKRYDPAYLTALKVIDSGELGEPFYAQIHSFGGIWRAGAMTVGEISLEEPETEPILLPQLEKRNSKTYPVIFEWIEGWIHEVNMARGLFGEAKEVRFASNERPRIALVEFEKAKVLFEVGLVAYAGSPFDEKIAIHCAKGRIDLEFPAPLAFRQPTTLTISTREYVKTPRLAYKESFVEEIIHFLRCIQGKETPRTTAEDALRDMELCFEIVKAGGD